MIDAGLTRLTHLDLFGARITDTGTSCFRRQLSVLILFIFAQTIIAHLLFHLLFKHWQT